MNLGDSGSFQMVLIQPFVQTWHKSNLQLSTIHVIANSVLRFLLHGWPTPKILNDLAWCLCLSWSTDIFKMIGPYAIVFFFFIIYLLDTFLQAFLI